MRNGELSFATSALLHVSGYLGSFNPAAVSANWAADGGGSVTNGAGNAQFFSFNVPANQTFVLVVSESNQNGGLNVPYTLKVTGLPGAAVPANQAPVNTVPASVTAIEDTTYTFTGATQISISDPDTAGSVVDVR